MSSRNRIDYKNLEKTWYVQFVKILIDQVPLDKLDDLFSNISIVCFNYDRCIQHFLIWAVSSHYSIHYEKSRMLVENLQILHPYGSIGNLPLAGSEKGIEFGQNSNVEIVSLSESIKTYTEQIEDNELLQKVRREVIEAETIVFLGFGFHPQNMNLLSPIKTTNARRVFATAKGFSNSDSTIIKDQIRSMLKPEPPNNLILNIQVRNDLSCAELFSEYRRTLATS